MERDNMIDNTNDNLNTDVTETGKVKTPAGFSDKKFKDLKSNDESNDVIELRKSEFDRLIQQSIKKNEANVRSKVEAELEKDRLTAEEQIAELRKELMLEKSRVKAEKELIDLNLDSDQTETILSFVVSENEEETVNRATFLNELIQNKVSEAIKTHEKNAMASAKKPSDSSTKNKSMSIAEKKAKEIGDKLKNNKSKTDKIINKYISKT